MPDEPIENFELELLGDASERRYRRLRPDIERLPWTRLEVGHRSPEALACARQAWTDAALQEYVGADAHTDLLSALIRARAPLDLTAMVSRFSLDELAHAELCARVAGVLGGGTATRYDPRTLYRQRKPGGRNTELEAAELAILNCCVAESWSVGVLQRVAAAAVDPAWRALRARLAKDEAVHAQAGWTYLDWLGPDLGQKEKELLGRTAVHGIETVRAQVAASAKLPELYFTDICPVGGFGRDGYVALATDVLEERVVRPLAARGLPVV
jgi:hypothetical protein